MIDGGGALLDFVTVLRRYLSVCLSVPGFVVTANRRAHVGYLGFICLVENCLFIVMISHFFVPLFCLYGWE